MQKKLNFNYALIHGTYWLYYGVIASFSSVFLLDRGYTNTQIGRILAIGNIAAVLIQPFLADMADRRGGSAVFKMMRVMTVLMLAANMLLIVPGRATVLLTVAYILAFAIELTMQPFANALNRKLEETGAKINFGLCRSLGSLTYATMCLFLGGAVEKLGTGVLPIWGGVVILLIALAVELARRGYEDNLPEAKGTAGEDKASAAEESRTEEIKANFSEHQEKITLGMFVGRHKMFMVMSLGILCLYAANSILNTYMAQIAGNVGGDSGDVGRIFALLAFVEIPTLVFFEKLHRRFSCSATIKFSSIAFVLWIGICAIAKNVGTLMAAQLMQPFSFALFLPSIVRFIDDTMEKGEAVKGQMVFTVMTTMAAVIFSLVGGMILDASGAGTLAWVGTLVTAIGALIIFLTVKPAEREKDSTDGTV